MPRVMRAAVSPGLCAPGPAGPSASTCATVVSRSCCLARAEARTAATSASHDTSARQANTAASDDHRVADVRPVRARRT